MEEEFKAFNNIHSLNTFSAVQCPCPTWISCACHWRNSCESEQLTDHHDALHGRNHLRPPGHLNRHQRRRGQGQQGEKLMHVIMQPCHFTMAFAFRKRILLNFLLLVYIFFPFHTSYNQFIPWLCNPASVFKGEVTQPWNQTFSKPRTRSGTYKGF